MFTNPSIPLALFLIADIDCVLKSSMIFSISLYLLNINNKGILD